ATTGTDSDSSSTSKTSTLIWVTVTYSDGGVATIQTTYSQKFSSQYTAVASPQAGSVGMGTLSGSIGTVKDPLTITVSTTNAANNLYQRIGINSICISGFFSFIAALLL
ncbi:KRE1 domain-containing protein ASCRUDRAFT_35464, partial [Ascoidea rubescens DSM 1968]